MAERQFQTPTNRFGTGGLNLRPRTDLVPPNQFTRYRNALRLATGSVTARPGQTTLIGALGGHTKVHSIGRLNDTFAATFLRILGIDQDLAYGNGPGAPTVAESGFSGNPLTMIAGDGPIPGSPWMYIADSAKMRKIRSDGLDLEIGLPKGVLISTTPVATALTIPIEAFDATDFNPFAGAGGGNPPTEALVPGPVAGNALEFTTDPGGAGGAYTSFGDKAIGPLNLTVYSNGSPVADSDYMHFWLNLSNPPSGVSFTSIYLVTGAFTSGFIPGVTPGKNDDYYVFQPNPAVLGSWIEFGTATLPVRRSDFAAHGAADWANVTGIVITMDNTDAVASTFAFDDFYVWPSLVPVTVTNPYDYRVTNYDPRTGVEGNPSDIQPQGSWLDNLQNVVLIVPQAYGDADIRQRAYRRGGSLPSNWYLVGQNTSNGGTISDTNSDLAIEDAPTVEINHDQPITTQDSAGDTILASPIPIIFGPVNGLTFGLGNTREPSTFYWTLPDRIDYWPANYKQQAAASGEELLTGCVWGGEGYVASNLRWFRLLPDLNNAANVTSQPTGATKGVISRWAMCVGPDGVYFVSDDGLYKHTGGPQENLTDGEMYPLFNGETRNGYAPIDFSVPNQIRLGTVLNEVWMQFQDTNGATQHLVWNALTREWRIVTPGVATGVAWGEIESPGNPPKLLLFGGLTTAKVYSHTGTSDDGAAISVNVRTPALDQGFSRNVKQYGDVVTKYTPNAQVITVQALLDDETNALAGQLLPAGGGTQLQPLNPFGDLPAEGRNIALDFSWSTAGTPPILDLYGVSYFVQPDVTATRISDWDDGGAPGEKYFKGCVLDCDTGGQDKTIVVEGTLYDGAVTTITTLTVNANGRRKLTFTWPRQAVTLVRIRPTDADTWSRWAWQWIFDEEPLALSRWETEPLDLAMAGWKMIPEMWLTLRSQAQVTLTVTAYYDTLGVGSAAEVYIIPSTAGAKRGFRQTLKAGKGVLYSFLFTTLDGSRFRLYREETHVLVKPIQSADLLVRHPFGNDDLDLVRGIQSAEGTALAPGGGQG
jgi:hypothetical protein